MKVTATTTRSMFIELLSADLSLCGHLINLKGEITMDTTTIGITIPGRAVITCQEYGHVPKNCIRTHFKLNYNRWLSHTTCFSCLKTGHISRYFPTRAKAPKSEVNRGKEKVDVEHIRVEMNRTWQIRD